MSNPGPADISRAGISSPWTVGNLSPLVWNDVFGTTLPTITRAEALSIPSVYRARAILLSLIADKPLNAWRKDELLGVDEQPRFLHRTPGLFGPWQRMAWTLDDLFFYGESLWMTNRSAAESDGRKPIIDATRVPYDSWRVDQDTGTILIMDPGTADTAPFERPADQDEVLYIPGPSEGLLEYASRTFRGAADLEQSWVDRAAYPSPLTELHMTDDSAQLDDDETLLMRDNYIKARRTRGGSVTVTPSNVEVIDHGTADGSLFIEGRNGARLDVAAFFNLPGAILDATTAQASLTYVTQEGTRTSVYDLSLPYWVRPIEARLSQDDVVPRGQSVRFDFSSLAPTAPQIATED